MKNNSFIKWPLIILIILVLFIGIFKITDYNKHNFPRFEGTRENTDWKVIILKSNKNTDNEYTYYAKLYWTGNKNKVKDLYINKISLYRDKKKYSESGDYKLSEYLGGKFKNGGDIPDYIATLENIPEKEIKDHSLMLQIESTNSNKDKMIDQINLSKKTILNQ